MELFSPNQKQELLKILQEGKTKEDLALLINKIIEFQNSVLNTSYKVISSKKLGFYLSKRDDFYSEFEIPKKTGGTRKISAPDLFLKKIQRRINLCLEQFFKPKLSTNGFIRERSIVTNAQPHIGKRFVFNIDLKDFFPSIHYGRIKAVLQKDPFNTSSEIAHLIAHLACYNGILPQGSPLSPLITNIICQALDTYMVKFAKHYRCYYSRYADDITFSSNKNVFKNDKFQSDLKNLIQSQGFRINSKKTRIQKSTQRQEVTGIIVNQKSNLRRPYIKNVRAMLHNWDKKGLEYCERTHKEIYSKNSNLPSNNSIPKFTSVLNGKIQFLGMVRGKEDNIFKRKIAAFNRLIKSTY